MVRVSTSNEQTAMSPTFFSVLVGDGQLEVSPVAQSTLADDLPLELEDRNTGAIEGDP